MITKEKIIAAIQSLPGDVFEADRLVEEILFMEAVEDGLKDSENGKVQTTEELLEEVKSWSK